MPARHLQAVCPARIIYLIFKPRQNYLFDFQAQTELFFQGIDIYMCIMFIINKERSVSSQNYLFEIIFTSVLCFWYHFTISDMLAVVELTN